MVAVVGVVAKVTYMSNTNTMLPIAVIVFAAVSLMIGLAIIPSFQEANANAIDTLSQKTEDNKDTTQIALQSKDGGINESDGLGKDWEED
jgi:hypothetical protein